MSYINKNGNAKIIQYLIYTFSFIMSSSSALAGAKKRRNVGFQSDLIQQTEQTLSKNNQQIFNQDKPTTSIIEVVKKHDYNTIFFRKKI